MSTHAMFSPSAAHRWINCPGSVELLASLPEGDTSSPAAEEGTHAHSALEDALTSNTDPMELVGGWYHDRDLETETAAAIKVAYDYVQNYLKTAYDKGLEVQLFVEQRVVPHGDEDQAGMLDIGLIHPGGVPEVIDYKHGKGVPVFVEGNDQLQQYLEGFMRRHNINKELGGFTTIIQPRCSQVPSPVQTIGYTEDQIAAFGVTVENAIQQIRRGGAPRIPGDKQCQWCNAKPICPELTNHNMMTVDEVFNPIAVPAAASTAEKISIVHSTLEIADPDLLTSEQVSRLLDIEPLMQKMFKAVRLRAIRDLNAGQVVPNWKLVPGRASRAFDLPAEDLIKMLASKSTTEGKKVGQDGASVRVPLSPAQAEKKIKPIVSAKVWANIEKHITKKQGEASLAPMSDPRPAINQSPDEVFQSLPDGQDSVDLF